MSAACAAVGLRFRRDAFRRSAGSAGQKSPSRPLASARRPNTPPRSRASCSTMRCAASCGTGGRPPGPPRGVSSGPLSRRIRTSYPFRRLTNVTSMPSRVRRRRGRHNRFSTACGPPATRPTVIPCRSVTAGARPSSTRRPDSERSTARNPSRGSPGVRIRAPSTGPFFGRPAAEHRPPDRWIWWVTSSGSEG
ncbi:Uncharacterised protein [Mycobacteroides abscessus]|nr:Uncharacterised protein [Mycobacteroides abscessus]SIA13731.1 Uncharacterised protein [Mycobacteroides abscessus subsp. abscessus]